MIRDLERASAVDSLRVGIFGTGRLGGAVREAAGESVAWQVGRGEALPSPADVAIDASLAPAVAGHLDWAAATGTDLVIAATGWSREELTPARTNGIGVLVAPNGSLTVALLARFARVLGGYAGLLQDGDPYVFDHHHRNKVDAPSGTARQLAEAMKRGLIERLEPTSPTAATATGASEPASDLEFPTVPITSLRAGHEVGLHRVGLDAPGESLEIRHQARSRRTFADGLLAGARWLHGRRGVFSMDDFAAATLDPIFRTALGPSSPELSNQ